MPDLLIELFSEEIPARMQGKAASDLQKLITDGLVDAGLTYKSAAAFSTPRRLTLSVEDLLAESKPVREERKGPKVGAPDQAIDGFLRGAGVTRDDLEIRDDKKGQCRATPRAATVSCHPTRSPSQGSRITRQS